jgi:hypothetical protein
MNDKMLFGIVLYLNGQLAKNNCFNKLSRNRAGTERLNIIDFCDSVGATYSAQQNACPAFLTISDEAVSGALDWMK